MVAESLESACDVPETLISVSHAPLLRVQRTNLFHRRESSGVKNKSRRHSSVTNAANIVSDMYIVIIWKPSRDYLSMFAVGAG